MKKIFSKYILLILTVFLLSSCFAQNSSFSENKTGEYYLAKLKSFKARDKNLNNQENDPAFDLFLTDFFKDNITSSYLTAHYVIRNYEALNIDKPEVSLGEFKDPFQEVDFSKEEKYLEKLYSFDYDKLSYSQQYDYEILEYSLYETILDNAYAQYDLLFRENGGIENTLITNLSEFIFYSKEDIDDYLTLLEQVDDYFKDAIEYTNLQAEKNIALSDTAIANTITYINGLIEEEINFPLINTFDKRIRELSFISEDDKERYIQENKRLNEEIVIPAYKELVEKLNALKGKAKDEHSLSCYSSNYSEAKLLLAVSDNRSSEEIFALVEDSLKDLIEEIQSIITDENLKEAIDIRNNPEDKIKLNNNAQDILSFLAEHYELSYPSIGEVNYKVSAADPNALASSTVAYYLNPAFDDYSDNIIRYNPAYEGNLIDAYTTFAHEGFPGHLYQNVYFREQTPHYFRSIIGFVGYSEGYAMKAESEALQWLDYEYSDTAKILIFDDYYNYLLQSLADIGVNALGWGRQELCEYYSYYNIAEETADYIYDFVSNSPYLIVSYGAGLAYFNTLEKETKQRLKGAFNLKQYHEKILINGDVPFCILEKALEELK